ncbi:MAG: BatD family protein [Planctomycetes bacterium]|nr:BatD family protein [Planctomycetota bacterium]
MSSRHGLGFWALLAIVPLRVFAASEEPEILVQVTLNDRPVEQVYEGQSVAYTVTLNHVENPSPPELNGFDDFDAELVNVGNVTATSGRMIVRNGREYHYRLTPRKTGALTIPAPMATVEGKVLVGPERSLRVVPAKEQDAASLEIRSDRREVFPMQPFSVTLSVTVKGIPEPHADRNPVSVQREMRRNPPILRIPWMEGTKPGVPDGLEPKMDLNKWASPLMNRERSGFNINGLTAESNSFFSVFEDQPAAFRPKAEKIVRPDGNGDDATYWQYEFVRTFTPKKVGRYTFGPVTLEGAFIVDVKENNVVSVDNVYAMAKPVEVVVKEVPEEGRPATYIGAVGRFQLTADLAPTEAKVGDPMTLTLTVRGEGMLQSASAPDLEAVPEIAEEFRIYEATEDARSGASRFTYSLRPLGTGIEAFPSVPVSYFDVESERYVTLRTDPIPIEVTAAERLSDDQIVATPGTASENRRDLQARREGVFANVADLRALRDESVRPGLWLLSLAGMGLLYVAVALVTVQIQRLSADKALVRRRGAVAKARGFLHRARAEVEAGRIRSGADLIEDSLVGLVADVADLPEAGLTPKDVSAQLQSLGVEEDLVGRVAGLLETCDATRYGSSNPTDGLSSRAQQVLDELVRSLKAKKRFR